ncbi:RadC family protein [Clostridium tertium]|uniref:RadC family protein n=1 Tax=Clostridium tertium TaxID=1559 RepID=UPI0023B310C3|nr:DNA repair protein RadC [Clostridium tertium]
MVNINFYKLQMVKEKAARYDINKNVSSPKEVYTALRTVFELDILAEEHLVMFALDTKNKIVGAFDVAAGSLNSSIVHPREVFKRALLNNAASIIVAHNHPSGDPTPSSEDINITSRLKECGEILGVKLLDHIIVGDDSYSSLKEKGLL